LWAWDPDAFLPAIGEFEKYLVSLKSPADFSAAALLKVMDAFQGPFEAHFRSEISTIAALAAHPRTPTQDSPAQVQASAKMDAWGRNTVIKAGIADVVPVFLYNLDKEFEEGLWKDWPPIPAPVRWTLLGVAGFKGSGRWRFASCDSARRRRDLYALRD
jgi:hypothetical protein